MNKYIIKIQLKHGPTFLSDGNNKSSNCCHFDNRRKGFCVINALFLVNLLITNLYFHLYFSPFALYFTLYTHLQLMSFFLLGRSMRVHILFCFQCYKFYCHFLFPFRNKSFFFISWNLSESIHVAYQLFTNGG